MLAQSVSVGRLLLVRLGPGEDVLVGLRCAVEEHRIRTGAILGGAGSLRSYHVHVVQTTNLPPGNVYAQAEGPFDILSLTGFVIDGQVHAHITFSNLERAMGGHLEEGCRVLTFALVTLAEMPEASLAGWDRADTVQNKP